MADKSLEEQKMDLIKAVRSDSELDDEEKDELTRLIHSQDTFNKIVSGALGAGLAHAVSRYLKLGTTARVLLSIAGYGVGTVLYKALKGGKKNKFMNFDEKERVYELN